jgi:hypothetical protein
MTYETHAHIGADGTLIIRGMPRDFAHSDVRVRIDKESPNGGSATARNEALARLAGAIDDPSFTRPAQEDYRPRNSLD